MTTQVMSIPVAGRAYHCHSHDAHLSFTEWTPGSISHWIGKCRHCKTAVRGEMRQDIRLIWQYSDVDKMSFSKRVYQYEALTPGARHKGSKTGYYVTMPCPKGCQERGNGYATTIVCKRIEGVYNNSIKCNAKCMNATGPNCECQCAGENHGGAHGIH